LDLPHIFVASLDLLPPRAKPGLAEVSNDKDVTFGTDFRVIPPHPSAALDTSRHQGYHPDSKDP
jgi:hypothetical protein